MQTRSSNSPANPAGGGEDLPTHQRTHWTLKEETELIEFLSRKKDAMDMKTNSFKGPVFTEAAIKLKPFYEKGAIKDATSCKTKWTSLKKKYDAVTKLKSLSGIAWDDEKGAGVTEDTQQQRDDLVKSNDQLEPFASDASDGWPYYEAMNKLITSTKAKGSNAYHGTQQSTVCSPGAATTSNSAGPLSSSTPLDILSSSSSSKRRFSQFDISAQSSSSLKRNKKKLSENTAAMNKLADVIRDFQEKVRNAIAREPATATAPARARLTSD